MTGFVRTNKKSIGILLVGIFAGLLLPSVIPQNAIAASDNTQIVQQLLTLALDIQNKVNTLTGTISQLTGIQTVLNGIDSRLPSDPASDTTVNTRASQTSVDNLKNSVDGLGTKAIKDEVTIHSTKLSGTLGSCKCFYFIFDKDVVLYTVFIQDTSRPGSVDFKLSGVGLVSSPKLNPSPTYTQDFGIPIILSGSPFLPMVGRSMFFDVSNQGAQGDNIEVTLNYVGSGTPTLNT